MTELVWISCLIIICTDLDVNPGDGQDGTGAPGGGADGAQWAAGVDRLHGNHRVARQERGKVGLPGEERPDGRHGNMWLSSKCKNPLM